MTYEESLALLRRLGDLHGDAARKAIRYSIAGDQAMALRFENAARQAVAMQSMMLSALMAEREQCAIEESGVEQWL